MQIIRYLNQQPLIGSFPQTTICNQTVAQILEHAQQRTS